MFAYRNEHLLQPLTSGILSNSEQVDDKTRKLFGLNKLSRITLNFDFSCGVSEKLSLSNRSKWKQMLQQSGLQEWHVDVKRLTAIDWLKVRQHTVIEFYRPCSRHLKSSPLCFKTTNRFWKVTKFYDLITRHVSTVRKQIT